MPRIYIHCKSSKVLTYSADMHLLGTRRAELPRLTSIVEHEPEESQKPGISLLTLSKGAHGQAKSKTVLGPGPRSVHHCIGMGDSRWVNIAAASGAW